MLGHNRLGLLRVIGHDFTFKNNGISDFAQHISLTRQKEGADKSFYYRPNRTLLVVINCNQLTADRKKLRMAI